MMAVNLKSVFFGSQAAAEYLGSGGCVINISSLAGKPIRQDLAMTGSVNQRGEVQPIGGLNQKIEGFHDVCRLAGFSGTQGGMLPGGNTRNLTLREAVLHAVA